MSFKRRYVLVAVVVVVLIAAGWLLSIGEVITLHPLAELPVEGEMNKSANSANVIATVGVGEEVRVLSCEDIKTDVYVRVQLTDGEIGFIHDGRFEFTRQKGLMINIRHLDLVTFSCLGWFHSKNQTQSQQ